MLKINNRTLRLLVAFLFFLGFLCFSLISKNHSYTYTWPLSSNIYSDSTIEGEIKQESQFVIAKNISLTIASSSSFSLENSNADINKILSDGGKLIIEKGATLNLNYSTDLRNIGNGFIENHGTINNNGKVILYGLNVINYGKINTYFPMQFNENSQLISLTKPSKGSITFDKTSKHIMPLSLIDNSNNIDFSIKNSIVKSSLTTSNIDLKKDPNIKISFKNNLPTLASIQKIYTSNNYIFDFSIKKDILPKASLDRLNINLGGVVNTSNNDNNQTTSNYSSGTAIDTPNEEQIQTTQKTIASIYLSLKENLKKGNYKSTIVIVLKTNTNELLNVPLIINLTYEKEKVATKKVNNNTTLSIVSLILFFLFVIFFIANIIRIIMIKTRKSMFLMKKGGSIFNNIVSIFFTIIGGLFFILVNDFSGKLIDLDIFTGWIFSVFVLQLIFFINSIRKN